MKSPDGVVFVLPFFCQPWLYFTSWRNANQPFEDIADNIEFDIAFDFMRVSEAGSLPLFLTSSCLSASCVPAGTLAAQVAVLAHRIPAVNKESVKRVRACGFISFALLSVF